MTTAAEQARINQTARLTRTQRELARLEAEGKAPVKKKPKPKKKPVEKAGLGKKDTSSIDRSIEGVKDRLRDAGRTKNLKKAKDLAGRLAALKQIRDSDA